MTKQEFLKLKEGAILNVTNATQTEENIDMKAVDNVKPNEDAPALEEQPSEKAIDKLVQNAEDPIVPADKDGVSKNGGESDLADPKVFDHDKKVEDGMLKDVVNVSSRKIEEATDAQAELLKQIQERDNALAEAKNKIVEINKLCEAALVAQREELIKEHSEQMKEFIDKIIAKGEEMENELTEAVVKNEKAYNDTKKLYEASVKLAKKLVEAVRAAQPQKNMKRHMTATRRAIEAAK